MTDNPGSTRSEGKVNAARWAGMLSIVAGTLLFISSALLIYVPSFLSESRNVSLLDPEVQKVGMFILYYFCFVGLAALVGVFISIFSVSQNNVWGWLGIIINIIVCALIPLCWVLLLTMLATG